MKKLIDKIMDSPQFWVLLAFGMAVFIAWVMTGVRV